MHILVIDDDEMFTSLLTRSLMTLGYPEVSVATNAHQAMGHMKTRPFQLLIVDWLMPRMSGVEFVKWVRRHPKHQNVPIIMCTSQNTLDDVEEAADAGINDYIAKPFHHAVLKAKIEKVLSAQLPRDLLLGQ